MEKCVCCGKNLPEKPVKVKAHTRTFAVCSEACKQDTQDYLAKDKRFKTALYLLVLLGGIGFAISAFFGGDGPYRLVAAYAGQLIAGAAFLMFPYPVISFESFHAMSIHGVTRLTRIIGALLAASAIVFLVLTLTP